MNKKMISKVTVFAEGPGNVNNIHGPVENSVFIRLPGFL
jgi:hypothetical protein